MCGVAGFLDPSPAGAATRRAICQQMTRRLAHRGPDGEGVWVGAEGRVGLGHRRLAIVDLSPAGAQPMASASGRFQIVYNGEIYNAPELAAELRALGRVFRGHSDTEVLLEAIEAWGLVPTLERAVGMWAFALWDAQERVLHVVRDRLGIKPLYYGWCAGVLLFGSELKALRAHPAWVGQVDRDALALQLHHSYVPAPWSIYQGIYKLMPGCVLSLGAGVDRTRGFDPLPQPDAPYSKLQPSRYWDPARIYIDGARHPFQGSADEAQQAVADALRLAVRQRMLSDVPLGAFLSGGIDSSLVVALMQAEASKPVSTFSIGFDVARVNESQHAAAVAAHLGTDHTELMVTAAQALQVVPELPALYDEPFSDSSQIPTAVLSKLTRRYVTVALSGDGGDEVFGGYNRYHAAPALWRHARRLPPSLRWALGRGLSRVPAGWWEAAHRGLGPALPARLRHRAPAVLAEKIGGTIGAANPDAIFSFLTASWKNPTAVVLGSALHQTVMTDPRRRLAYPDFVLRMMHGDLVAYLPDDILVKVDRASMGASLEARVPLLDHRVIELAATLPRAMLLQGERTKLPLRRLLDDFVPRALIERPKQGFGVPLGEWLRGPLRDWAEALLDADHLAAGGFFDAGRVRRQWDAHLSGRADCQARLWDVLMFQAWLEAQ